MLIKKVRKSEALSTFFNFSTLSTSPITATITTIYTLPFLLSLA